MVQMVRRADWALLAHVLAAWKDCREEATCPFVVNEDVTKLVAAREALWTQLRQDFILTNDKELGSFIARRGYLEISNEAVVLLNQFVAVVIEVRRHNKDLRRQVARAS